MMEGQQTVSYLEPNNDEASHTNLNMECGDKAIIKDSIGSFTKSVQNESLCQCKEKHTTESDNEAILETLPWSGLHSYTRQDDSAVKEWVLHKEKPSEEDSWHLLDLEQSLPQPAMYSEFLWRDWENLCETEDISDKQFDFSVLSYNILSQDLADQNPELYQHCDPSILHWDYRWPNILQELQHWEADIICLQEVQQDHYKEHVEPSLSAIGYSCHFKRRTGRKTDGCCTCYKTQRFMLLSESHVEFFRPGIDVLNRDNVGLVLLLKPLLPDAQQGRHNPIPLCVANTHLLYNPRRGDIKLAQLALLLAEVDKISLTAHGSHYPVILCGDLNATPDSPLYHLLRYGYLNYRGMPSWKVSGQEQYCTLSNPRILPPLLWPDYLGVTDNCQYAKLHKPKNLDKPIYTRQQLLELRYCECALQRPPHLVFIKGVTDNEPDDFAKASHPVSPTNFPESPSTFLRLPFTLRHSLHLKSAYSHFLPSKGCAEVTTLPMGIGSTVDYIFYSVESSAQGKSRQVIPVHRDSQLKLLGHLRLLCEDDLWVAQGLPNPFCCSDHLCLLARFSMDLTTP
ncbi:hypothetical protein XENTR_v10021539 [Xenopus tropicalis]|nr:protein angel homolog 1 isoform X2 [Xenopus tropicalis]KAE8586066.1 hypothetical protein XENTR_v10021539 [Xenopus tropicalis]